MTRSNFAVIENRIPDTRKQIRLLVFGLAQLPVLDQLQKNLVNEILRTAPLPRNGRRIQHKRRPMLAIQDLDLR